MNWYYDPGWYKRSVPRKAKGGIKAQTARGRFGQSWWGRRWIEVLEGFNIGARLHRGRKYARSGQVLSIDIGLGTVRAEVQGSRARPYAVDIQVKTLTSRSASRLAKALGRRPLFTAQLLRGEMPADIEAAFKEAGATLFPKTRGDLITSCSCPDWSNPCKHIAAVFYLLGEEFDRDPFLIFRMRGVDREKLVSQIRSAGSPKTVSERKAGVYRAIPGRKSVERLPADPGKFWSVTRQPAEPMPPATIPRQAAGLPKQLGPFPFWRGEEPFLQSLEEIYPSASYEAMGVLAGEVDGGDPGRDTQ